jgi:hypothetical protein
MPEGWAHLGVKVEELMKLLRPDARAKNLPPGTASFIHCMTEHGVDPPESGITTTDEALAYKAKSLVRECLFWIHKGISVMDVYCAYDGPSSGRLPNTGFGLMLDAPAPKDYAAFGVDALMSPALTALKHVVATFAGADPALSPRVLNVRVWAVGRQTNVFEGDGAHPALASREMFTFLPYQVTGSKFVCAAYVMTYDITSPMPPMDFVVTITGVNGRTAKPTYYDPITNGVIAVNPVDRRDRELTVRFPAVDYPRLLTIDNA